MGLARHIELTYNWRRHSAGPGLAVFRGHVSAFWKAGGEVIVVVQEDDDGAMVSAARLGSKEWVVGNCATTDDVWRIASEAAEAGQP